MSIPENDHFNYLLRNDPGKLIISCQGMISCIVQHIMIDGGLYHHSEKQEKIQEVTTLLLEKIDLVRKNYMGRSRLKTYMAAVIRNLCREICRKELFKSKPASKMFGNTDGNDLNPWLARRVSFLPLNENILPGDDHETEKKAVLHSEFERLEVVLQTYNEQRTRIEICLKSFFKILVSAQDIDAYFLKYGVPKNKQDWEGYFYALNEKPEEYKKQDIYSVLTGFFNHTENKKKSKDAIRKYLEIKMDEIVSLLNGNPPTANYTKHNLGCFLELFYEWKSEMENSKKVKIINIL